MSQHGRNEVAVQRSAQQHKGAKHHHQVVHAVPAQPSRRRSNATMFLKRRAMYSRMSTSANHGYQLFCRNLVPWQSADVAQGQLREVVVRVSLVQKESAEPHLIGGHGFGAGRDLQSLVTGGRVLASLQGQAGVLPVRGGSLLHLCHLKAAVVAQGDHGTASELSVRWTPNTHAFTAHWLPSGGKDQELLRRPTKSICFFSVSSLAPAAAPYSQGLRRALIGARRS